MTILCVHLVSTSCPADIIGVRMVSGVFVHFFFLLSCNVRNANGNDRKGREGGHLLGMRLMYSY